MGLFKNVGRKVERFRQAAKDAAAEEASHRCADCGKHYYTDHDFCPECGGTVEPIEPADEPAEATDGVEDADGAEDADAVADVDAAADAGPGETSADETATEETGATEEETATEAEEAGTDGEPTEDADSDAGDGSSDE